MIKKDDIDNKYYLIATRTNHSLKTLVKYAHCNHR